MFLNTHTISVIVCFIVNISPICAKCTTPNGEISECIPIHECSTLLETIRKQEHISIEFVKKSQCGYDKVPLVCCGTAGNYTKPVTTKDLLPSRRYCGYQHSDDYLSNGNGENGSSTINEFPWLAALIYIEDGKETNLCVGSLISNRYVLTTAHCIVARTDTVLSKVRLGEYNIQKEQDCVTDGHLRECSEPTANFGIDETFVHNQYNRFKHLHDIGLIRLNKAVVYSDYIRPICLPVLGSPRANVGDTLVESGWGQTSYLGDTADIKKKVLTQVISQEDCKKGYEHFKEFTITEDHLCTKEFPHNGTQTCQGDSGGPVMFSHRSQWFQEGIVTFGLKCGSGSPDVNGRVANYIEWIVKTMRP